MEVEAPENLRAGLVSIGLPVYNGARYLREALDSLVSQDYADIEIIVSDNASEDDTDAICRAYAASDPRIRYYRAERNMGAVWNAVHTYELARGEYFLLAAHDDLRHPQYVSRCVAQLERNPRALLCCTGVRFIDEAGRDISNTFPFQSFPPVGVTARERLLALLRSTTWLHFYSLIRTPALAQTRFGQLMWGGDVVLTAEMCVRGEVEYVPDKLFSYRIFSAKTGDDLAANISTAEVTVTVSWTDLTADLIESVHKAPLSLREKFSLKWMILTELCVRHEGLSWAISDEVFGPSHRALASGKYCRAVRLALIGIFRQTVGFFQRIANSIRYRAPRVRTAMVARKGGPSAAAGAGEIRK